MNKIFTIICIILLNGFMLMETSAEVVALQAEVTQEHASDESSLPESDNYKKWHEMSHEEKNAALQDILKQRII